MRHPFALLFWIALSGWAPASLAQTPFCQSVHQIVAQAPQNFHSLQGRFDREWNEYEVTEQLDQLTDCTISVDSEERITELRCTVESPYESQTTLASFQHYLNDLTTCLNREFDLVEVRRPDIFNPAARRNLVSNRWYRSGADDQFTEVSLELMVAGSEEPWHVAGRLYLDVVSGRQLAGWTFDPALPGLRAEDPSDAGSEGMADLDSWLSPSAAVAQTEPGLQELANVASSLFQIEPVWFQTGQARLGSRGPLTDQDADLVKNSLSTVREALSTLLKADPAGAGCRMLYWYVPFSRVLDRPRLHGRDELAHLLYEVLQLENTLRKSCNLAGDTFLPIDPASASGADLLHDVGLVLLQADRPDLAAQAFELAYRSLHELETDPRVKLAPQQLYETEFSVGLYNQVTDLALCAAIAATRAGLPDAARAHATAAAKHAAAALQVTSGFETDVSLQLPMSCASSEEVFLTDPEYLGKAAILVGTAAEAVLEPKQQSIFWMRLWSWLDSLDVEDAAQTAIRSAAIKSQAFGPAPPAMMPDLVSLQLQRLEERRAWNDILDLIEHTGTMFRTHGRADEAASQVAALLNLGLLDAAKAIIDDGGETFEPEHKFMLKFVLAEYYDRTGQPSLALEEISSALRMRFRNDDTFNAEQIVLIQAELFQQASKVGNPDVARQAIEQLSVLVWPYIPSYNNVTEGFRKGVRYTSGAVDPNAVTRALRDQNADALIGAAETSLPEWGLVSASMLAMSARALNLDVAGYNPRRLLEKSVDLLQRDYQSASASPDLQDHLRRIGIEMAAELAVELKDEQLLLQIIEQGLGTRADFAHIVRRARDAGLIARGEQWLTTMPALRQPEIQVPATEQAEEFRDIRLSGQYLDWTDSLLPSRTRAVQSLAFDESIDRSEISRAQAPVEKQLLGEALLEIFWQSREQVP